MTAIASPVERPIPGSMAWTSVRTFGAVLWRDVFVTWRELAPFLAQVIIQPFFMLFIFGKVLTGIGYVGTNYTEVLLPGIVALNGFLGALQNTTLPLSADYVHNLGLSEVKRITGEMEAIMRQVGFKGSLSEFFTFIRTDPRFKPASKEALRDGYYAIGKRVNAAVPKLFSTIAEVVESDYAAFHLH